MPPVGRLQPGPRRGPLTSRGRLCFAATSAPFGSSVLTSDAASTYCTGRSYQGQALQIRVDARSIARDEEAETTRTNTEDTAYGATAVPTNNPTTWYLQGPSEILSAPSAASGAVLWGSMGVMPTESVDGFETRNIASVLPVRFRRVSDRPTNPPQHTSSARALQYTHKGGIVQGT